MLSAVAALGVAVAGWLAWNEGLLPWPGVPGAAALAFLAVGVFFLQQAAMPFHVRGERIFVALEEPVVLVALLTTGTAAAVLAVALGTILAQLRSGRSLTKAAFNVAAHVVAASVAALAYAGLTMAGLDVLAAGVGAIAAYALACNALSAAVLARVEGRPFVALARERFVVPAAIQVGVGASGGLALHALWLQRPIMMLAALPLAYMVAAVVRTFAEADRSVAVGRLMAETSARLQKHDDPDAAADAILSACGRLFAAGRATLRLNGASGERAWTREFEGGPAAGLAPLEANVHDASGGVVGVIRVEPARRNRLRFGRSDHELLQIMAGQASAVLRGN